MSWKGGFVSPSTRLASVELFRLRENDGEPLSAEVNRIGPYASEIICLQGRSLLVPAISDH